MTSLGAETHRFREWLGLESSRTWLACCRSRRIDPFVYRALRFWDVAPPCAGWITFLFFTNLRQVFPLLHADVSVGFSGRCSNRGETEWADLWDMVGSRTIRLRRVWLSQGADGDRVDLLTANLSGSMILPWQVLQLVG